MAIPKMNLSSFMNPGGPQQIQDIAAMAQMAQADPTGMAKMMAGTGMTPPPVESVVKPKSVGSLTDGQASTNLITRTPLAPPPGSAGTTGMGDGPALSTPVGQSKSAQAAAGAGGESGMDPQKLLEVMQALKAPEPPPQPQIVPGAGVTPGRPGDPSAVQNAINLALGPKPNMPMSIGQLINGR